MRIELSPIRSDDAGFHQLVRLADQTKEKILEEIELDWSGAGWIDANMGAPLGAVLYKISRSMNTVKKCRGAPPTSGGPSPDLAATPKTGRIEPCL